MMSPWRYPGGKARLSKTIIARLPAREWSSFTEPFVGGGGLTFAILPRVVPGSPIHLNDADPRVAAWWQVMIGPQARFDQLVEMLSEYTPTVSGFYWHRDNGLRSGRLVERAFAAMVTNRCAFSGILSGGPIGGNEQRSKYDVGCRYNPTGLARRHVQAREFLSRYDVRVTSEDFREFLDDAPDTEDDLWYLDPPYVRQGPRLYPTTFDVHDHDELASRVLKTDASWAASYDNDPYVHEKYADESVSVLGVNARYTITAKKRMATELLILPD